MAWTQKTKPSPSGSQKRAKAKKDNNSNNSADQKRARAKALMTQAEGKTKKAKAVAPKPKYDNNNGPSDAVLKARAAAAAEKKLEASEAATKARIAKETAASNALASEAAKEATRAKNAKDAKAKAKKIADDKAQYKREQDLAAKVKAQDAKDAKAAKDAKDAKAARVKADQAEAKKAKEVKLAQQQAKDAKDAKAKAKNIADDKAAYKAKVDAKAAADKQAGIEALALAKKKAKIKRDNKARIDQANANAEATIDATKPPQLTKPQETKAEPKQKSIFENIFSFLRDDDPVASPAGSSWLQGSPHETNQDSTERLPTSTGAGMLGAGVANYPTGEAQGLELPSSPLGMLSAVINPMGAMVKEAGSVFMNQSKYGMNDEAKAEYDRLIRDPANEGKSAEELVQLARKPQMDRQLPHAFIDGNPTTDVQKRIAKLTNGKAPSTTIYNSDGSVNIGATAAMVSTDNTNNQGNQSNPAVTPAEIEERIKLGQLTTGGAYAPTVMPDDPWWAPQGNQGVPVPNQPSWAPQWNQQAKQARPSWAPKEGGMLKAPMTLQAPPSRWS